MFELRVIDPLSVIVESYFTVVSASDKIKISFNLLQRNYICGTRPACNGFKAKRKIFQEECTNRLGVTVQK